MRISMVYNNSNSICLPKILLGLAKHDMSLSWINVLYMLHLSYHSCQKKSICKTVL